MTPARSAAHRVVDVDEDEAETSCTWSALAAPVVGTPVRGEIDWLRRFDHMQQHTGQHVLSAVLERRLRRRTVSFHLGTDSSTIDLARELTAAQIATGGRRSQPHRLEDVPVTIRYATEDEAGSCRCARSRRATGRCD